MQPQLAEEATPYAWVCCLSGTLGVPATAIFKRDARSVLLSHAVCVCVNLISAHINVRWVWGMLTCADCADCAVSKHIGCIWGYGSSAGDTWQYMRTVPFALALPPVRTVCALSCLLGGEG